MTAHEQQQIIAFALSKVGLGYIMGATGWICTQSRLDQQAAQYPDSADMIAKFGKKWLGVQCYDCAQLTRAAAKEIGISMPSGATSQATSKTLWESQGTMDTFPSNEPGIFLYRYDAVKKVYQHTGISIGDGTFVDANSTQYGILRQSISKYAWTHWRRLLTANNNNNNLEGGTPMENLKGRTVVVDISTLSSGTTKVNIRENPDTASSRLAQVGIEDRMYVVDDLSNGWLHVQFGDVDGYIMKKYVLALSETITTPEGTINYQEFYHEVKLLVDKYTIN